MLNYQILINKQNKISPEFINNLTLIDVKDVNGNLCKLEKKTYQMYDKLSGTCINKNIYIGLDSTYRNLEAQEEIYKSFCDRYGKEYADLIKNDAIFKNIHKILPNFGFILRYMEDKKDITGYDYEPWHIRYVGINAAKMIAKQGICLEEYHQNSFVHQKKNYLKTSKQI